MTVVRVACHGTRVVERRRCRGGKTVPHLGYRRPRRSRDACRLGLALVVSEDGRGLVVRLEAGVPTCGLSRRSLAVDTAALAAIRHESDFAEWGLGPVEAV